MCADRRGTCRPSRGRWGRVAQKYSFVWRSTPHPPPPCIPPPLPLSPTAPCLCPRDPRRRLGVRPGRPRRLRRGLLLAGLAQDADPPPAADEGRGLRVVVPLGRAEPAGVAPPVLVALRDLERPVALELPPLGNAVGQLRHRGREPRLVRARLLLRPLAAAPVRVRREELGAPGPRREVESIVLVQLVRPPRERVLAVGHPNLHVDGAAVPPPRLRVDQGERLLLARLPHVPVQVHDAVSHAVVVADHVRVEDRQGERLAHVLHHEAEDLRRVPHRLQRGGPPRAHQPLLAVREDDVRIGGAIQVGRRKVRAAVQEDDEDRRVLRHVVLQQEVRERVIVPPSAAAAAALPLRRGARRAHARAFHRGGGAPPAEGWNRCKPGVRSHRQRPSAARVHVVQRTDGHDWWSGDRAEWRSPPRLVGARPRRSTTQPGRGGPDRPNRGAAERYLRKATLLPFGL